MFSLEKNVYYVKKVIDKVLEEKEGLLDASLDGKYSTLEKV